MRRYLPHIGGLALAGWSVLAGCSPSAAPTDEVLVQAHAALRQGDFNRAEQLAVVIPETSEEWGPGLMIAGEAATKAGRPEAALRHYQLVAKRAAEPLAGEAHYYAAEVCRELGRLWDAEEHYRAVLVHRPDNAATHERLAFLLSASGRCWEAVPHYWFLVRSGTATEAELMMLADPDRPFDQRDYLKECIRKAPDDPFVRLGLAAYSFRDGALHEAEPELRSVIATHPEILPAQAMLGELLVEGDSREFRKWHQALPALASQDPDIWYVRGTWARRHGELPAAARCYWEAVRLAPMHRRATYELGQILLLLRHDAATDFASQSNLLIQLTQVIDEILRVPARRVLAYQRTAELLEELGRTWEACAWAVAAEREFPDAEWPHDLYVRLGERLSDDLPLIEVRENLALRFDLSTFPDHRDLFRRIGDHPESGPVPRNPASIRFVEQAAEAGIHFTYFNGPDPSTKGVRMFEQNGGGAAAIDFDADSWPDLYFAQGAVWEHDAEASTSSARYADSLYRNLGGAFMDVSSRAQLAEQGFGQGCASGDIDNDGFADIYVANIGHNRLYRNNGDGTFVELPDAFGPAGETWTASCVIVDLNADALPDLFDVTYLQGEALHQMICSGRACSPGVFGGAPDRLHINRGDGTFASVPVQARVENSKGLGVVAAAIDEHGRPDLFIANDQVPNFHLRNLPFDTYPGVDLEEGGLISGFAYNVDGIARAGMGIAADDADGNGLVDFLVTNFSKESNTFYLQVAPGMFQDATRAAGLHEPSFAFVGWGTQFLDADLDGNPDLVLVNGHVDDYRDEGGEFHMRPQFFRNVGNARFAELYADEIGPYFEQKYLGRGLARLDWNRDGRMDFVVSNIGDAASLVANVSTGVGHFLNVRLHATITARDAIGAVVHVVAGDRRWSKQLTAGDGFMASNERMVQFGLGNSPSVNELRVDWPSGANTTLHDLPVDVTLQIVEDAPQAYVQPP